MEIEKDIIQEINNSLQEIKADIKRITTEPIVRHEYNKSTASKYLEISIPTIERYMARGLITYIERNGRYVFLQKDLDDFRAISPSIKYKKPRSNINNKE